MCVGILSPWFGYGTLSLMCLILPHCFAQNITLTPQSPAMVRKGQPLVLTCQSNQTSELYTFTYIDSEGNTIRYALGGGGFQSCQNITNDAFIKCDFGTPWKFKLTLLNPVHDQVVYCHRSREGQDLKNSSTTIFVQVPVSSVTLSPSSSVEVIEGQSFALSCVSKAARPAANITWHKEGVVLIGSSSILSMNNLLYDVTSNLTSSFQRTDNGSKIYCTAVNINGDTPIVSAKAELNVIYAPTAAPQLTADVFTSVDEGQPITLRCTLSTLGNPHITWSWVCGDDTLSTGVTNTGTQSVLTLTANRKYNQRTCQCRATSPRSSLSYSRTSGTQTITVYYAPIAAPQLTADGSTSVDEGQSITLRCTLSTLGNPHITWNWVCGDDTLSTGVTNTGTQSVLTLTANRKYNQRTCQCRATSPRSSLSYSRTSGTQTITVYYAPFAAPQLTADGSTSLDEGWFITLRCTLSTLGNPPITWNWVCGDGTLTTEVTNTGTQSVLTLTANRKYNQRTCQCRATSRRSSLSYNRTSGTENITVYYAPTAAPQLTADGSTSVDEGQSITLECTLSTLGNPHITWNWVCGYDTLSTGVTNTGTQSVLILTANRKYNQKTCHCRARSPRSSLSYSRTSGTQTITVYYNNIITSTLNKEYVTNEHGRLQIRCNVDGNPLSTITWMFVQTKTVVKRDIAVRRSSLDISSANCLDHGIYKVTFDNGKGPADFRTTHVAVRCKPRLYGMDIQTLGIGNNESLQIHVRMVLHPPATLIMWTFAGQFDERKVIQNNTGGYSITDNKVENKQNIFLYKRKVETEDFGQYTIMVLNDVGYFTRIYHVNAARPPLKPTNLALVCATSSVKLSWISNFNGGDNQIFTISYSTDGEFSTSYKDLRNISDEGYDILHNYTSSIDLHETVWFTVTASNIFGKSTSDTAHCIVKGIEEFVILIVGSILGSVALIIAVLGLVILLKRRYRCTCIIERKTGSKDVKAADLSNDGSGIHSAEQNVHGESSELETYECIQGSSAENTYEDLSTNLKKQDEPDQIYCNSNTSKPEDVYVNTSFQN
ncbi:hemicentin-1-like [Ostrea edulis]|uniref:hemicentin-1-like n=1 Tax=Ostrea edulis TaxID=37623 RepID=UPI0024AF03DF|nr:hemicentin-1-like [Ostrea edulis]